MIADKVSCVSAEIGSKHEQMLAAAVATVAFVSACTTVRAGITGFRGAVAFNGQEPLVISNMAMSRM